MDEEREPPSEVAEPQIDCPLRETLLSKNAVFQKLIADFPTTLGKETSKAERDSHGNRDPSLTYGELDFLSIAEVFADIELKYGGLQPGGVFYDLGSGSGKGVLAAALLHPFARCHGIEVLEGLYYLSLRLKDHYDAESAGIKAETQSLFPELPEVRFSLGSFFDVDWSDATFFFANSTCFDLAMMAKIADRPVAVGSFAITLTKNLPGQKWQVLQSGRKPMSWGEATVFLHQRVQI